MRNLVLAVWYFGLSVPALALGAGLRVRCLYGTDARESVQVCGRTCAQHPYLLLSASME